jgi:DNA-binding transcriptional regulator YiaG
VKKGRPRKLSSYRERVMLEEVRMSRYFSPKKIRERYGLSQQAFSKYLARAYDEGRL